MATTLRNRARESPTSPNSCSSSKMAGGAALVRAGDGGDAAHDAGPVVGELGLGVVDLEVAAQWGLGDLLVASAEHRGGRGVEEVGLVPGCGADDDVRGVGGDLRGSAELQVGDHADEGGLAAPSGLAAQSLAVAPPVAAAAVFIPSPQERLLVSPEPHGLPEAVSFGEDQVVFDPCDRDPAECGPLSAVFRLPAE